ncbi:MAG TPA: hypothetical protein VIB11_15770 [Pedococcus sp.]|uniref:hypothetical protein n=1 Tax=Pedococcus sp. TaxID=2860345 RepID=UPI002F94C528
MIRRVLLLLAGLLLTLGVAAAPAGAASPAAALEDSAPADTSSPVVLIGTGGITWTDVSETATPALWSFLRDGSSAALSVRSVNTNTCPIDGWLGLSAGARAAAPGPGGSPERRPTDPCPQVPVVDSGEVPGWNEYVRAAASKKFDAQLGLLGEDLATQGVCVQSVGPGAGVGGAFRSGTQPRYAAFNRAALTSALAACPVTLVDVGSVRDPADVAEGEPRTSGSRAAQVKAVDQRIQQVVEAAPAGADLVVASLSDAGVSERLRLVAAKGPHFGSGTLESPSTRQPGLVQAPDLTVTLMSAAGAEVPSELGGAAVRRIPAEGNSEAAARDRLQALVDYDQASHEVHSLVPPFFNAVVYTQLAIYVLVLVVWRRDLGPLEQRTRLLRLVRRVGVIAATVPAATFLANLIPWWRFPAPMLAVVASVGLFVAALSALALLGPWGRSLLGPMAVVSGATMAVLALDVMTGSRLQLSSLMGLQPVVGGRFYGMGNTTFALFATSTILLCIAVSDHFVRRGQARLGAIAVAAIGLGATFVDGAPFWGADGGGPPALLPGLAFLVLSILGVTMTWRRGLVIAGVTVAMFLLVGFLDWLRPVESRSHLGRFFQTTLDGGALDVITRKLDQNLSILFGNYRLALLVPIALVFVIYVLARPTSWGSRALQRSFDRAPTLRPGLIALLVTLTIGFAVNDSGVAVPANGALIAVPLIIAVSVTALLDEARAVGTTRASRRR